MAKPFKMKGSPAKLGTIEGTAGHASALKHTRRREGHMATYGAGHTNEDHPDYWTKDTETGTTPKSKEVAADKEAKETTTTTDKETTTTTAVDESSNVKEDKKNKNFLQKLVGKFKKRGEEIKEKRKGQKRVLKNPFNVSEGYEWVDK